MASRGSPGTSSPRAPGEPRCGVGVPLTARRVQADAAGAPAGRPRQRHGAGRRTRRPARRHCVPCGAHRRCCSWHRTTASRRAPSGRCSHPSRATITPIKTSTRTPSAPRRARTDEELYMTSRSSSSAPSGGPLTSGSRRGRGDGPAQNYCAYVERLRARRRRGLASSPTSGSAGSGRCAIAALSEVAAHRVPIQPPSALRAHGGSTSTRRRSPPRRVKARSSRPEEVERLLVEGGGAR